MWQKRTAPTGGCTRVLRNIPAMTGNIGNRLDTVRHRQLVGRTYEITLFHSTVTATELPFCLLYVHGPGGIGKTTVLHAFAAHCRDLRVPVVCVDGRHIEPTLEAFQGALRQAQNAPDFTRRCVLLIDTYEALEPLDGWIREDFLPRLPADVLVVLAGREPLSAPWRADAGWQTMIRALPLHNLSADESRRYLAQRAVPSEHHQSALNFTHGHPLALSLVADVIAQRGDIPFDPKAAPDVIQTLLERFVRKIPGAAHRAALEACALVHVTTESLLAEMLAIPDARDLFEWLRGLSFVEAGRHGLFPHDVAREALIADLRWRNPDRYSVLHRRARSYYIARFQATQAQEQQRVLLDSIFLHRDNAVVREAFAWQHNATVFAAPAREADHPALRAMVTRQEGEASAHLLAYWLARQPQGVTVFRESGSTGEIVGMVGLIALHQTTPADRDADPAVRAAWDSMQRYAPLRPGEQATLFRFWMARDTYQNVCPILSLIFAHNVRYCLTIPGLACTFFPCSDPDFWSPMFAYAEMSRLPEADFAVGGRRYGTFGHDWRKLPPLTWMGLLAEKEMAEEEGAAASPTFPEPLLILSEPEFAAAVREAIRLFSRPEELRASPLLRSRIVAQRVNGDTGSAEKVAVLRGLIREALESLQARPRQARGSRAVYHTYLFPAATQEQAADILNLPFSTYRRHLCEGISWIAAFLWCQEIDDQ